MAASNSLTMGLVSCWVELSREFELFVDHEPGIGQPLDPDLSRLGSGPLLTQLLVRSDSTMVMLSSSLRGEPVG